MPLQNEIIPSNKDGEDNELIESILKEMDSIGLLSELGKDGHIELTFSNKVVNINIQESDSKNSKQQ